MRVGKRGYIETPSKLGEVLLGEPFHRWYVYMRDGALVFEEILNHRPLGIFGDAFYAVFYFGIKRIGHKTFIISNKLLARTLNKFITLFLRKLWVKLRKLTYTCFEWEDEFRVQIIYGNKN